MEYVIRPMLAEDIAQVQDVARRSWNTTYDGIIPLQIQERFLISAYSDAMMLKRLERSQLYVAVADERIVGFANFSSLREEGEAELSALYLYPEYQGKGIGSALLQEGIRHCGGAKEVYINVEKENAIGRSFYEAKGFTIVKEFDDDFEGHVLRTVRMVLAL